MDDAWCGRSASAWEGTGGACVPGGRRAVHLPFPWDGGVLLGLLLILCAVLVSVRFAEEVDRTVPVWAARTTLPVGEVLTSGALQVVRVRLSGAGEAYVGASSPLPSGLVVVRAVGRGELLPRAAVRPRGALGVRPVVVPVHGTLSQGIRPGTDVDVWVLPPRPRRDGHGGHARLLLRRAGVYAVGGPGPRGSGRAGARQGRSPGGAVVTGDGAGPSEGAGVEVLVATPRLREVLDLLALGERLVLLPVPGEASRAGTRPALPPGGSR